MIRTGLIGLRLPALAGTLALGSHFLFRPRSLIHYDSRSSHSIVGPNDSLAQAAAPVDGSKGRSRFGGKLDYHQLTFGSFAGLITGYLFGRISRLLVTIVVSSVIATEYLSSAGWIDLKPVYSGIFNWSKKYLNQEILVDDPSFKLSFLSAFLVAAYNA